MGNDLRIIKHSLTKKITLGFIIVISVIGMFVFSGYYYYTNKYAKQGQMTLANNCARTAAKLLTNAPFDKFLTSGKDNLYNVYFSALSVICQNFNLKYIYVYVPNFKDNTLTMVFDIDGKTKKNIKNRDLGTVVHWPISQAEKHAFYRIPDNEITETNNEFGHVITKYSAVYDRQNRPVALVGVDVSVDEVNYIIINNFLKGLLFIFSALFAIYIVLIVYLKQIFIKPITLISSRMKITKIVAITGHSEYL